MLSKCANPGCASTFRYLRKGLLFHIKIESGAEALRRDSPGAEPSATRRIEHYWLCEHCCSQLALVFRKEKGVITVPLPHARAVARQRGEETQAA